MFYFFHILPPEQSSLTTKQSFWNNFCWTQYQAEMVLWIFNCRTVLWGRVDVFLYTYKSIPEKYIPVLKNKFSFPYSLSLIKSFSRSPIPSFPSLYAIVDWKKTLEMLDLNLCPAFTFISQLSISVMLVLIFQHHPISAP